MPQPSTVLKLLVATVEDKWREVNSQAVVNVVKKINFGHEAENARSISTRHISGQLKDGDAWAKGGNIKQKLVVPAHIVSTQLRPDLVLWSDPEKVVYFGELL